VDAGATWLPRLSIAADGPNTSNWAAHSAARDTMVGFINIRFGGFNRFGWSWETGQQWNFYNVNALLDDRFVVLSNGIHLVRRQTAVGLPRAEVSYLYSNDFGQTWTPYRFLSSPDSILSDEPDIAGDDNGNLYALWRDFKYGGVDAGTVLMRRSTDFGATWLDEQRLTPTPSGRLPRIACSQEFVASVWRDDSVGGVVIRFSHDYGQSFNNAFVLSSGTGAVVDVSVPFVHVASRVDMGGGNGEVFYHRGRIVTTTVPERSPIPARFALFQNYPNPFNTQTTFRFNLPERTHVRLSIYDVLGREVEVIVSDTKEPGTYNVRYHGWQLASGVYFYRLQTSEYFAVKKVVIIK